MTIWFGQKLARLRECRTVSAEVVAKEVTALDAEFFRTPFAEREFLRRLRQAYELAVTQEKLVLGQPVRLRTVLPYLALLAQDAAFLADPRREKFRTYSWVHLACGLFRLRERRVDGHELVLHTATRAQTRRMVDFI